MVAVVQTFFFTVQYVVVPWIKARTGCIRIHLQVAFSEKLLVLRMKAVIPALFFTVQYVVMLWIYSVSYNIRVFRFVAFTEKHGIRRVIAVIKPFAQTVNHIMLPWRHAMPGALRIKAFVTFNEKTALALCKHPANQILWIKRDFHRSLIYLAKYRTNNVYNTLCTVKITAKACLYQRYQLLFASLFKNSSLFRISDISDQNNISQKLNRNFRYSLILNCKDPVASIHSLLKK